MNLRAAVYKRDISAGLARYFVTVAPPNLDPNVLKVISYSHRALGGPYQATLEQTGDKNTLMSALNLLRCPVEIYDDYGQCVWWGYIHEVGLKIGSIGVGVSLDTMANVVKVAYTGTAQEAGITDWAVFAESAKTYGYKCLIETASELSLQQAETLRDVILEQRHYPVQVVSPADPTGEDKATLTCRGWWDTLGWVYYENTNGLIGYTEGSGGKATIGDLANSQLVRQRFTTPDGGITTKQLRLKVCKTGSPTDNVNLSITDLAGTYLAIAVAAGTTFPSEELTWMEWALAPFGGGSPTLLDLAASTTYRILIGRSGANDANNYYWCALDTGFAPPTGFAEWDNGSSTWVTRLKDQDGKMLFQLNDLRETTEQIETIVTSEVGQFITGVAIGDASGITSCQYRDGSKTALEEVEALLKAGTSNSLRLLAKVLQDRSLYVYEEAPKTELTYIYKKDGSFTNMQGVPYPKYTCPVACWVLIQEAVDFGANLTADATRLFLEETAYDVASDTLTLTPRDSPNPLDVVLKGK